MSFRDFKEEIYLVLQIKEGHGFGFATLPLVITANLAGNVIESFIIEPCSQPKFENEFVWVMDKNKMKSIWLDKVPIRVECLAVNQSLRSRVGYIILNIKDAQILQDQSKISEKQTRLLGLSREAAVLKPELILSFYITDIPIQSPQMRPQFSPPLDTGKARMTENPLCITLGSGKDHFRLSVVGTAVANLEKLVAPQSHFDPKLITYCYEVFGAEILSDSSANHKLQLRLTSSLPCLRSYCTRQPTVTVRLTMDELILGQTIIDLENLLSEDTVSRRTRQHSRSVTCRCFITPANIHPIVESAVDPEARPYVDFTISLTWETPPPVKKRSQPALNTAPTVGFIGAGGDAARSQCKILPLRAPATTKPLTPHVKESGSDTYRANDSVFASTHIFTVTVTRLTLEPPLHLDTECWLKLNQSSANVSPELPCDVATSRLPMCWTLSLTLPSHLLIPALRNDPVTLQLGRGDQLITQATLSPPENIANDSEQTVVLLVNKEGGSEVGKVGILWGVREAVTDDTQQSDVTLSPTTQSHLHTQLPSLTRSTQVEAEVLSPRARELKILGFVEELEDWAEKQRVMIMEGLKEEEAAHLSALQRQWECEVGGQVTEGRQLIQSLHDMRNQLKTQEDSLREKELKLKIYKEELERVHQNKLQEFKDLSRRMQDEFNHKLGLIAGDKVALEHELERARDENEELKRALEETQIKHEEDRKMLENHSHELRVVSEKLLMESESKRFFKEHCRKAEQEIYRLSQLRQQDLEARLNNDKRTLEQLAFQHIILERNDLRQDQRLLEEIKQQLYHRPEGSDTHSSSNVEETQTVYSDERHIRRAT